MEAATHIRDAITYAIVACCRRDESTSGLVRTHVSLCRAVMWTLLSGSFSHPDTDLDLKPWFVGIHWQNERSGLVLALYKQPRYTPIKLMATGSPSSPHRSCELKVRAQLLLRRAIKERKSWEPQARTHLPKSQCWRSSEYSRPCMWRS